MKTIALYTLGCKVNQYDTQAMLECFERAGYAPVDFHDDADVYLINTCTVTGTGDQKSVKTIRRIHREHPQAQIIVAGCLAQRDAQRVRLPGVRLILGVRYRAQVAELLERALAEDRVIDATADADAKWTFENLNVSRHEGKTRAVMKIQEGCDRYCAYCVIPYVRGPVRSMPLDALRMEARALADAGYREIVLTGIHLASYGRDHGASLMDALRAVQQIEGVRRIRLGSLEPMLITDEFVREMKTLDKVCPQFHLSMQSGSAGVLRRMHRRYTPAEYMAALECLRAAYERCAITTDVLTGFPGETEEEAEETLDFVRRAKFARIHVFPYSRRTGTVADRMPDQVEESVKQRRAAQLIELGNQLERAFVQSLEGKTQEVLFEQEIQDGLCEGYTPCYVRVRAKARPGALASVHIDRVCENIAYGVVLEGGNQE